MNSIVRHFVFFCLISLSLPASADPVCSAALPENTCSTVGCSFAYGMHGTISITNVPQIPFLVSLPSNACDISTGLWVTGFSPAGIQYNNDVNFNVIPTDYRPISATPVAGTYYNTGVSNDRANMLTIDPLPVDAQGNRALTPAAGATFGVVNYVSWQMSTPPDCNVRLQDNLPLTTIAKGSSVTTYASNLPRGPCATHTDASKIISTCSNKNPWDPGFPNNVFDTPTHWNGFNSCTDGCPTGFGGVPHTDIRTYYPATAFDCSTEGQSRTCMAGALNGPVTHVFDQVNSCVSTCTVGGDIAPGPVGFPGGVCINPLPASAVASYAELACCGGTAIRRCNFAAGGPIEYICSGVAPSAPCSAQSLSWTQGVNTCSANFASIPASSTSPLTNSTAATTAGSATASCQANGTWGPASGSCVSTAPALSCNGGTLGRFEQQLTNCATPGNNPWVRPGNITTLVSGTFLGGCPGILQQGEYCLEASSYNANFCTISSAPAALSSSTFHFCTPSTLICGSAASSTPVAAAPAVNLCSDASMPAVTNAGSYYSWNCGTNFCSVPRAATNCPSGPLSWTVGADTCTATFPVTSPGTTTATLQTVTAGKTGDARFACDSNGSWGGFPETGATCGANTCQNYRTDFTFSYTEIYTLPPYGSNSNAALRASCEAACTNPDPDVYPYCVDSCYWTYPPQDYLASTPPYIGLHSGHFGGGGGGYFWDECPPGQFVNQITGRSGNYIDGIQAHCSGGTSLPYHGGGGGGPFAITCAAGNSIAGVRGRSGSYLDFLAGFCATNDGLSNGVTYAGAAGGGGGGEYSFSCPKGSVVAGISGRSGRYLDALTVRCRPATSLQVCACPTAVMPWTQGANNCSSSFYSTRANDLSWVTNNSTPGFDGSARYRCQANGTWSPTVEVGATCAPRASCGGVSEPTTFGAGCGGSMIQDDPGFWYCSGGTTWLWNPPECRCRTCAQL